MEEKFTKKTFFDGETMNVYRNEHSRLHREDGPALICSWGYQEWRINGRLHRTDR